MQIKERLPYMAHNVRKFWREEFRWRLTRRLLDLLKVFALRCAVLVGFAQREVVFSEV